LDDQPGVTAHIAGYTVTRTESALAVSGVGVVGLFVGLHLLNLLAEAGGAPTAALLDTADERSDAEPCEQDPN